MISDLGGAIWIACLPCLQHNQLRGVQPPYGWPWYPRVRVLHPTRGLIPHEPPTPLTEARQLDIVENPQLLDPSKYQAQYR